MATMRINRRFLYLGTFLVAIGAVLVVADLTGVDEAAVLDWLRLWPLAVVAIGAGIVLRRTRFNLASGVIAAVLPGLVLGGAFAAGPRIADCGAHDEPSTFITREGTFDGPTRVDVSTGCGSLVVHDRRPATGGCSTREIRSNASRRIEATATSLSIDNGRHRAMAGLPDGRDVWRPDVADLPHRRPRTRRERGRRRRRPRRRGPRPTGCHHERRPNDLDLTDTSLSSMSGTVNAGQLSVALPSSADVTGSLVVNAGCAGRLRPGRRWPASSPHR